MAWNEVTGMIQSVDIVKNLEKARIGVKMGDRAHFGKDECANLLIEEDDAMIRLVQAINKTHSERAHYESQIESGYITREEVEERNKFSRYGPRTLSQAQGLITALAEDGEYWKEFYHELTVDDKLCREDPEQFPRTLQYIGDFGWNTVLDRLVEVQDLPVDHNNQLKNRLMRTIKTFFLMSQQLPPMRRVWERKEEVMPILIKCMVGQNYDVLNQTALVLIIHLILATKSPEDINWLVTKCEFIENLVTFIKSVDSSKKGIPLLTRLVLLAGIAVVELGGDDSHTMVKKLDLTSGLWLMVNKAKSNKQDHRRCKELFQTYKKIIDNPDSVKYFTRYPRERRISFRWEFRAPTLYCSYPDCGRPPEPDEKFRHCSRCMVAYYCSQECQKQHWKYPDGDKGKKHKIRCVPLPNFGDKTSVAATEEQQSEMKEAEGASAAASAQTEPDGDNEKGARSESESPPEEEGLRDHIIQSLKAEAEASGAKPKKETASSKKQTKEAKEAFVQEAANFGFNVTAFESLAEREGDDPDQPRWAQFMADMILKK